MSDLVSKDSIIDLVKRTAIEILEQCKCRYEPEIEDYVYDDIREVDAVLKFNKVIQVAINNMESEHELISRSEAIKSITQYNGVVDKSVAKRILSQIDSSETNTYSQEIKQQKIGEWNMLVLISSAWYGKQCYFEEDNDEIVYSKLSGKLLSKEDAIKEFIKEISE